MRKSSTESSVYIQAFEFNQDGSCFIAATTSGFRVYTCSPLSEFARRESFEEKEEITEEKKGKYEEKKEEENDKKTKEEKKDKKTKEEEKDKKPKEEEKDKKAKEEEKDKKTKAWPFRNLRLASMLYRSSCFALVAENESQKVLLWDDKKAEIVTTIWCRQPVLNVLLGRDIICVVSETAVYIYQSGAVTPLTVIITGCNPKGLCSLSESSPVWRLACPATTPGVIRVQSATCPDANAGLLIAAHRSPLSYIAISSCGTYIGTASEVGTLIRLFRSYDGCKIDEFRLGAIQRCVRCIRFRIDARFLIVSSSSSTIHIFKLKDELTFSSQQQHTVEHAKKKQVSGTETLQTSNSGSHGIRLSSISNLSGVAADVKNLSFFPRAKSYKGQLSTAVANISTRKFWIESTIKSVLPTYFESQRSFAQFHLPLHPNGDLDVRKPRSSITEFQNEESCNSGPQCVFGGRQSNHVYVIHNDGFFYEARFDAQNGGECQLLCVFPWFAPRHDFVVEAPSNTNQLSHGLLHEPLDEEEAESDEKNTASLESSKTVAVPVNSNTKKNTSSSSTTEAFWQLC